MTIKPIHKLLAALMLSSAFVTANAASITLQPSSVDAAPGDTITLDVFFDFTDQPTLGGGFNLYFDSSVLTYVGYTNTCSTPSPCDPGFNRDPDVGDGVLTGIAFGNFNGIGTADQLGVFEFEVNAANAFGSGLTAITMADNVLHAGPFLIAGTFTPIQVAYEGAQINVVSAVIPIPAALWLMICGIGALMGFGRKTV